ncbi:MAG: YdcF family protein [bacterium]
MKRSSQSALAHRRSALLSNKPKALVTFAFLAIVLWLVAWAAANWLMVSAPLARADAIVVLAGSAAFGERTQRAAELYKQGRAAKIILTNDNHQSGWVSDEQRNIPFQELAGRWLRRQGVPAAAIEFLPEPVSGTYDESLLLRQYAEAHGLHSLLVVTSAYHSRRALWTLRQTFSQTPITIGLESVPPGQQAPSPRTWWLHFRGWQMVPVEYVKLIYYGLAHHSS